MEDVIRLATIPTGLK